MTDELDRISQIERRIEKCRSTIEEFSILQEQLGSIQSATRSAEMVELISGTKRTVEHSLDILERELKSEKARLKA